ncbi:MAG: DUF692 domain-containing protein, partial [Rhodospirillaceae bacterium]|nr:DUF692 domain-containing protein [Rhodospirillaceae bacterium]
MALRHEFADEFATATRADVDFVEVTAEHYFRRGGRISRVLRAVLEQVPAVCHALNTNLGGPAPLDERYLLDIRRFLDAHRIDAFSDHLCHRGDEDWMHNLMPIPFTEEAIRYTAGRIRRAQEVVERPVAVENISYLTAPAQRMSEAEFVAAVLLEADCRLMLDVNNLYINSINMGYDAEGFLEAMPLGRIAYAHVAGHSTIVDTGMAKGDPEELVYIDTHGHAIAEPVSAWSAGSYLPRRRQQALPAFPSATR